MVLAVDSCVLDDSCFFCSFRLDTLERVQMKTSFSIVHTHSIFLFKSGQSWHISPKTCLSDGLMLCNQPGADITSSFWSSEEGVCFVQGGSPQLGWENRSWCNFIFLCLALIILSRFKQQNHCTNKGNQQEEGRAGSQSDRLTWTISLTAAARPEVLVNSFITVT